MKKTDTDKDFIKILEENIKRNKKLAKEFKIIRSKNTEKK